MTFGDTTIYQGEFTLAVYSSTVALIATYGASDSPVSLPSGDYILQITDQYNDGDGYLTVARSFLSRWDLHYLPDCIRLIPLELGLRFLTDHLEGDVYFRTNRADHNLHRAAVQFRLTASIEAQMDAIRALVRKLGADIGNGH